MSTAGLSNMLVTIAIIIGWLGVLIFLAALIVDLYKYLKRKRNNDRG